MTKTIQIIIKDDEDFDFCKELNQLMEIQERIDALARQIYMDIAVFGKAKIIIPKDLDK